MRIAVFRAAADAAETGARLAERGHDAVLAPVIRIARIEDAAVPTEADAVVFTSAHAPAMLDGHALASLARLPCWCVGPKTAAAAAARGFATLESGPGDAAELAGIIRDRLAPGTRLLLLLGQDRKPALETRLADAGFVVTVAEVYRAEAVPAWDIGTCEALQGCSAALHYSRRSAEIAVKLAEAHMLLPTMQGWHHHCLSPDVAASLRGIGMAHVRSAAMPNEASLLAGIETHPVLASAGKAIQG